MTRSIYQGDWIPASWVVESCEPDNDGIIRKDVFTGDDAENRAYLYEAWWYRGITPHTHVAHYHGDELTEDCSKCGLSIRHNVHFGRNQRRPA